MERTVDDVLMHFGVKGMKWGVRKTVERVGYKVGAKLNPREAAYKLKKIVNKPNASKKYIFDATQTLSSQTGVLPTDKNALKAIETMGIQRHSEAKYSNLDSQDLRNLKTYTDSARYSRSVNSYLAIGEPKDYADEAKKLKTTLQKNKIDDQVVYRSCNLKFSVDGIANKLQTMDEKELESVFGLISKNFIGKSRNENRVFSTSTSPLFAIDTWRAVNPTAASTYNTYMIINCKKVSGVYADGKTDKGRSLVNTKSNQECILAPSKLTYRKLNFDQERGMFAITIDVEG